MVYTDQVPHAVLSGQFDDGTDIYRAGEGDGRAGAVSVKGFGVHCGRALVVN